MAGKSLEWRTRCASANDRGIVGGPVTRLLAVVFEGIECRLFVFETNVVVVLFHLFFFSLWTGICSGAPGMSVEEGVTWRFCFG